MEKVIGITSFLNAGKPIEIASRNPGQVLFSLQLTVERVQNLVLLHQFYVGMIRFHKPVTTMEKIDVCQTGQTALDGGSSLFMS